MSLCPCPIQTTTALKSISFNRLIITVLNPLRSHSSSHHTHTHARARAGAPPTPHRQRCTPNIWFCVRPSVRPCPWHGCRLPRGCSATMSSSPPLWLPSGGDASTQTHTHTHTEVHARTHTHIHIHIHRLVSETQWLVVYLDYAVGF